MTGQQFPPFELEDIPRACFVRACELAIRGAEGQLRTTPWAFSIDEPFQLILLRLEAARTAPAFPGPGRMEEFLAATMNWAYHPDNMLGRCVLGPEDHVPIGGKLSLNVIAALKARTAARLDRDIMAVMLYLAAQGDLGPAEQRQVQLEPGDVRSFGGTPVNWVDMYTRLLPMIGAGTGAHPMADSTAVRQVPSALVVATAEAKLWVPQKVPSREFVLTSRPTTTIPALP